MSQMVLELNASDDRSVHDVQIRIKAFASMLTSPLLNQSIPNLVSFSHPFSHE